MNSVCCHKNFIWKSLINCFIINYWIWSLIMQIKCKINIWFKLNLFKNHMFILKNCVKGNIHMFYSNKFWSFSLTITHVVYLLKFCFCFFCCWKLWMEPSHINIVYVIWGQIKIYWIVIINDILNILIFSFMRAIQLLLIILKLHVVNVSKVTDI